MTCGECELSLAQDEFHSELEAHVAGCPGCRALAAELQANAHVMRAMGMETLPAPPIQIRPEHPWWKWSSAAAAVIITLGAAWWASRPSKPPQIVSIDVKVTGIAPRTVTPVPAEIPKILKPAVIPVTPVAQEEPLRVKMLTPDPDVVIYWLVDGKEE